jgi:hypothetical protein
MTHGRLCSQVASTALSGLARNLRLTSMGHQQQQQQPQPQPQLPRHNSGGGRAAAATDDDDDDDDEGSLRRDGGGAGTSHRRRRRRSSRGSRRARGVNTRGLDDGVELVSRPFPSWNRSILTDIYLCHACSCQEILRTETAAQAAARGGTLSGDDGWLARSRSW